MQRQFEDTESSNHQKQHALRVIGNLGSLESFPFLRTIILDQRQSSISKQTLPTTLEMKLLAVDALRNLKGVESLSVRINLLLSCLRTKADRELHLACTASFLTALPNSLQQSTFISWIQRHGIEKDVALLFEFLFKNSIHRNDAET